MKFILMLLGLFIIACLFYGIAAGVQTMARSATRLTGGRTQPAVHKRNGKSAPAPSTSALQRGIRDLQELHQLYKSEVLSAEEFDQLKHILLSTITSPTAHTAEENP
jgi:hypothetical protein